MNPFNIVIDHFHGHNDNFFDCLLAGQDLWQRHFSNVPQTGKGEYRRVFIL
jgi:hypothetical protein